MSSSFLEHQPAISHRSSGMEPYSIFKIEIYAENGPRTISIFGGEIGNFSGKRLKFGDRMLLDIQKNSIKLNKILSLKKYHRL